MNKGFISLWVSGSLLAGGLQGGSSLLLAASAKPPIRSPELEAAAEDCDEPGQPTVQPAAPRLGEPINDHAVLHYLEREGLKLIASGRASAGLPGQLGRAQCSLALAPEENVRLSAAEVGRRAEESAMVVARFYRCGKCSKTHMATASGFMLSSSGALATALHVLESKGFKGLVAMNREGRVWPVREVLAADRLNDSLIVQLEGENFRALPLCTNAPVGSPVVLMSHPGNHFFSLGAGIVSRHAVQTRRRGSASYLAITAPFGVGSSGGPVLNEAGAVVAMANNTEPVFTENAANPKAVVQLTVFNCTPARALRDLVQPAR